MRTTVNLDEDITRAVERLRAERGLGLSEAVNELARRGLTAQAERAAFQQRVSDGGARLDIANIGSVLELLDSQELAAGR